MVDKLEALAEMDAARASAAGLPEWRKESIADGWAAEGVAMSAPTPTAETGELCPDCGRPLGELPPLYRLGACVGRKGDVYRTDCLEHTIARLRAELSTLRERNQHLEEAARILATIPDTATLELNGGAEWPAHCAWLLAHGRGPATRAERDQLVQGVVEASLKMRTEHVSNGEVRDRTIDAWETATDALLAHRGQETNGNR